MTYKELRRAIREAPTIWVGVAYSADDMKYVQITKAEAMFQFGPENKDVEFAARVDPDNGDLYIG